MTDRRIAPGIGRRLLAALMVAGLVVAAGFVSGRAPLAQVRRDAECRSDDRNRGAVGYRSACARRFAAAIDLRIGPDEGEVLALLAVNRARVRTH
jgi:hypothetical protein